MRIYSGGHSHSHSAPVEVKKKIQSQNNYLKIYLYFLNFVYLYFLGEERRQKGEKGKENGRKG